MENQTTVANMHKLIPLQELQKPIQNIRWRTQSFKETKYGLRAVCIPYIDARDVQQRLDEVCGIDRWQDRYKEVKGNLFCEIGILVDGKEWIWKSDVGKESEFEKEKGEASDSFKRAAVMWGIGRHLYTIKPIVIPAIEINEKKYAAYIDKNDKKLKAIYDNGLLTKYCNIQINKP